jgi:hypothetical protein
MRYLTKRHLSRRTVLRGAGVCIALPLLDAMSPAGVAWSRSAAPPRRMIFVGFPHGAVMRFWSPEEVGGGYKMSPILEPLERFREHLTIVSGLRNKPAESPEPHAHVEPTWLTCVPVRHLRTEEHGFPDAGVSADQLAVRFIGQETRLPSLELTAANRGAPVSWRTPTQSLPQQYNPRTVFYRLFGQGDTAEERSAIVRETGSILDRVRNQAHRLQASLGTEDEAAVSDYLDSVREIERRVQMAQQQDMDALAIPDAPVGVPNDYTAHVNMMFDLMALALQADLSRVITFTLDREVSMRSFANLGITEAFHPLSHHGNDPAKEERLAQIQRYYAEMFARFVEKLATAREGEGTVLDHSTILFASNMSDSNRHDNDPLPAAVLGHAHGRIKGGQHLVYPPSTPFSNLLVTLFDRGNIPVESLGDSTGPFAEV